MDFLSWSNTDAAARLVASHICSPRECSAWATDECPVICRSQVQRAPQLPWRGVSSQRASTVEPGNRCFAPVWSLCWGLPSTLLGPWLCSCGRMSRRACPFLEDGPLGASIWSSLEASKSLTQNCGLTNKVLLNHCPCRPLGWRRTSVFAAFGLCPLRPSVASAFRPRRLA